MKNNRIAASALALLVSLMMSSGVAFAAKPAPSGKVNINTASVEQLATLPGVGPALAARIVEHRTKAGSFKNVQELMSIRGIGEKSFQKMESHLTTGGGDKTAAK
jgi:competence protein ComEA